MAYASNVLRRVFFMLVMIDRGTTGNMFQFHLYSKAELEVDSSRQRESNAYKWAIAIRIALS